MRGKWRFARLLVLLASTLAFKIDGQPAAQPNSFWINDSQFQHGCAGLTMPLGATQDWKLSVCGCEVKSDDIVIRHRFDDYSGAYVIHCHFLGHEDRGMMWNVQTVCPASGYGQTQAHGGADDCAVTKPALPQCAPGTSPGHDH